MATTPPTRADHQRWLRQHATELLDALATDSDERSNFYLLKLLRDGLDAGVIEPWQARQEIDQAEWAKSRAETVTDPDLIRSTADLAHLARQATESSR